MDAAPSPTPPPVTPASAAWPRAAQLAAAALLGGALVLLLGINAWGRLRWGSRPTDLETGRAPAYRIDLNRADRAELLQLPGIGPNLAERIETYRRESGGFRSVDDLRRVNGIGPATLTRLRPWVCVEEAEEDPQAGTVPAPRKPAPAPAAKKSVSLSGRIDLNAAPVEELRNLPGIGPKLSQAILDEREKAPFRSVDDLRRVHGIGAKTLDKLRPYVTVRAEAVRVAAGP
jgi:competence protein ComEA